MTNDCVKRGAPHLGSEQALAPVRREAELQNVPNIMPVCTANIHRQKNGGLERTYSTSAVDGNCDEHPKKSIRRRLGAHLLPQIFQDTIEVMYRLNNRVIHGSFEEKQMSSSGYILEIPNPLWTTIGVPL